MIESVAAVNSITPISARTPPRSSTVSDAPSPQPVATGFYQITLSDGATLLAAQEAGQKSSAKSDQTNAQGLTPEQQAQVSSLRKRDAEVRRHESAHASAGGPYAGAASFEYQRGPDGRLYAIGGEVKIDVTPAGSPEATIQKMEVIKRAALAPADPSSQDRAVAAAAEQIKQQAQAEQRDNEAEETEEIRSRIETQRQESGAEAGVDFADISNAVVAYNQIGGFLASPQNPPGGHADIFA